MSYLCGDEVVLYKLKPTCFQGFGNLYYFVRKAPKSETGNEVRFDNIQITKLLIEDYVLTREC